MHVNAVLEWDRDKTDFFIVKSGVRQGESLSPMLFIIVLDYVMRKVERAGNGMEWVNG